MARRNSNATNPASGAPAAAIHARASGHGWSLTEYLCMAGPDDAPFEEARDGFTMAAVLAGTFRYKADTGEAILHPGALLLGNDGACYACGHEHSRGDRCLAINIGADLFAELAASSAGTSRFRFPRPMHPACPRVQTRFATLLDSVTRHDPIEIETHLLHLVEQVLGGASSSSLRLPRVSAQDEKRITRALQHIERHFTQALDLDALSAIAGMSKYHFLRTFRRVAGQPPHQYLVGLRLARVADRLAREPVSISQVVFESGFGDLSTFNARFKRHFGESPTAWRRRYGR